MELWSLCVYLGDGNPIEVCGTEEVMRDAFNSFNQESMLEKYFRATGCYDTADRAELSICVEWDAIKAITLHRKY